MVAGETGSTVAGGGMDADGGSAVVRIILQEQNTGAEDGLEKIPLERVIVDNEVADAPIPICFYQPSAVVPKLGQLFKEDTDGFAFYNLYARFHGFGIRRHKKRDRNGGVKSMQEFCCVRQGIDKSTKGASTRIGCKAMIRLNRFSERQQWMSIVQGLVDNGMPPTGMYGLLSGMHGGPGLAPFTRRAVNRLAYSIRRDECADDIEKTLEYFQELQSRSKNLYYTMQTDGAGRIKNLFWSHALSRLSFEHFGDVVTFDTTYQTNMYNMPLGVFVGVNNHCQTVVFGCAMMREETVESFKWLFRAFSKAMHGKKPAAILTDNCYQMEAAIKAVWPGAYHRVCKWHILKNAKENLGNIYSKRSTFKDEFHRVLNEPQTIDEFEKAWTDLIKRYNLEDSVYLKRMWDIKEKWAPVYFKSYFFAKMSTTQRSESMNHVLKKYVRPSSPMNVLVRKYESFFYDRIQEEDAEEFHTSDDKVITATKSPLEKHAARVYTRGAYKKFKEQFVWSVSYDIRPSKDEHHFMVIHMGEEKDSWGRREYDVYANIGEREFSCVCKLFEHMGILCRHILKVMVQFGFREIPEQYVKKRWTRSARDSIPEHLKEYVNDNEAAASRTYRHDLMYQTALDMVRLGDTNTESYRMTMDVMCKHISDLKILAATEETSTKESRKSERLSGKIVAADVMSEFDEDLLDDNFVAEEGVGEESFDEEIEGQEFVETPFECDILPPEFRRGRGRPKVRRFKSKAEMASQHGKKSGHVSQMKNAETGSSSAGARPMQIRYCGSCGQQGHNKSTCGRDSTYKRK
ncbi:hypothetical protein ACQJBY_003819 [Aegilops geniculata]